MTEQVKDAAPILEAPEFKKWQARAEAWERLSAEEKAEILQNEADAERAEVEALRLEKLAHRREAIPVRYRSAICGDTNLIDWLTEATGVENEPEKENLLLTGPTGTGKTWTLFSLVRYAIDYELIGSFSYFTVPSLLARMRPNSGYDPAAIVKEATESRILLLDDLGANKHSEWVEETLFQIVDTRYMWRLPTVFATNVPPGKLAGAVGDRLASRVAETALVVPVTGNDRRRTPAIGKSGGQAHHD